MDERTNTIAGWTLAACGAALGFSIVGGLIFHGERPEKMGYAIEGVEEAGAGGEAAAVPIASLLPTADAAKGAEVFKKCAACHTINQGGANGVGPNLYGTVGEAIAQGKAGFAFSEALKGVGGTWDFDKLNAWLTSPRKFANGTKMTFAGLGNAQDRANVILYLKPAGIEPAAARCAGARRRQAGRRSAGERQRRPGIGRKGGQHDQQHRQRGNRRERGTFGRSRGGEAGRQIPRQIERA